MNETDVGYFQRRWDASPDPWDHAGRWYEARKYDLTVAVLPHERYRHAVEPACGVGLLTVRLADRADRVSASDRFERAVDETATRTAAHGNVTVSRRDVRDGPPPGEHDLVVLGEVLYYFDVTTAADVLRRWHRSVAPGGHLVLTHFRPTVDEHVLDGDGVHSLAHDLLGRPRASVIDPGFLVDVFDAPAG